MFKLVIQCIIHLQKQADSNRVIS